VPYPLSLGQVQCSISPLYSLCVMMVHCLFFSFVGQFDYGCCSQAQEMISVINYLPCFGEWLITCPISTSCFSSVCLLMVHAEISSLLLPLSPAHFQHSQPLCYCARLQFTVCCSVFFGGRVSLPRGFAGLSQRWLREFCVLCGAHLFSLLNVSQTGLELVVAAAASGAALKISQCNVLWESFPQFRGSGCQRFDSGWCFISA
jgi:hypothetical protein